MFEKFKDVAHYEDEIRKIKKAHFKRISDLEDENHRLKNELKNIEVKYERQILELKQQVQMELQNLEHSRKEIGLLKEQTMLKAEREIIAMREIFNRDQMNTVLHLAEKEKETLRAIIGLALEKVPGGFNLKVDGDIAGGLLKKLAASAESLPAPIKVEEKAEGETNAAGAQQ